MFLCRLSCWPLSTVHFVSIDCYSNTCQSISEINPLPCKIFNKLEEDALVDAQGLCINNLFRNEIRHELCPARQDWQTADSAASQSIEELFHYDSCLAFLFSKGLNEWYLLHEKGKMKQHDCCWNNSERDIERELMKTVSRQKDAKHLSQCSLAAADWLLQTADHSNNCSGSSRGKILWSSHILEDAGLNTHLFPEYFQIRHISSFKICSTVDW